jgi:periplasmic protein TonB
MTWLAQTTAAIKPMHGDAAPIPPAEATVVPTGDPHPSNRFVYTLEADSLPWWRSQRFTTFGASFLVVLWFFANVIGVMTACGFFAARTEEPNELPTIEIVVLGSVGDGYHAGQMGRQEGSTTQTNLRQEPPAAPSPQPQASKPMPPAPPPPAVPVQPTQPKPVVKPTQPEPKPSPTFPKPQPTKPREKELLAQNAPSEVIPVLPPPPPPILEKPKTPAPTPTKPAETKPKEQPPSPPAVAASPPSQDKPSQPATTVAANGTVGANGGASSKGDSDHNGSGRRRGTRGSGGEGDGVDPPSGFYNPQPFYPPAALAEGREGIVTLLIRIGADGSVETIEVHRTSGHKDLDHAALSTVRYWRYNPSRNRRTRESISSTHTVEIKFSIKVNQFSPAP